MTSGERWRLGHRPGLDGLRGIAIALVVVGHTVQVERLGALGSAGVTVFFTLSGFLITALLLQEAETGRVSLRRFYARRARRLFPALAVVLLVVAPWIIANRQIAPRALTWVFLYVANWAGPNSVELGALSHTWSLAIEEQFYVLWPLVLILGARRWRNGPLVIALAGIAASCAERFVLLLGDHGPVGLERIARGTDTRADALLVGCALAILVSRGLAWRPRPRLGTGAALGTVAVLVVVPVSWADAVVAPTIVPWVTVLGLLYALGRHTWLEVPAMRWLGSRSYGIYLWHYPVLFLIAAATGNNQVAMIAGLAVSLVIAEASWRWLEQPVLRGQLMRKKSKYASTPPPTASSASARPTFATLNGTV